MSTITPHQDHVAQGLAAMREIHATRDYATEAERAASGLSLALIEAAMPVLADRLDRDHSKEATADMLSMALGNLLATAAAHLSCCRPHASHTAFATGYNAGVYATQRLAGEPDAVSKVHVDTMGRA